MKEKRIILLQDQKNCFFKSERLRKVIKAALEEDGIYYVYNKYDEDAKIAHILYPYSSSQFDLVYNNNKKIVMSLFYTEGEYKIIEEMGQATEWKHYSKTFSVEGADGTFIFGFVSYAAEVRDQAMAIDNFKIFEKQSGSVSEIAAGAAVTYHDGMLNVPADIESVAVYDMQGRMVISTTETGTISLEGLSDGVYVVKAVGTEGGAVQTLKIVK